MNSGALWIALAALLWSTDAVFRSPVVGLVPAETIVLFEHAIGFLVILAWTILNGALKADSPSSPPARLTLRDWLSAAVIGAGGSAVATLLFTASFRYVNPSVAILIQKTQPLFVILLARVFLGEKPAHRFLGWALIALTCTIALSVPDFSESIQSLRSFDQVRGPVYALSAAVLWAWATVSGRRLTLRQPRLRVLRLRYAFGLLALIGIVTVESYFGGHSPFEVLDFAMGSTEFRHSVLYMALVPGLLALFFYYRGLEKTPAVVATMVELIFPIGAIAVNWWLLNAHLSWHQGVAAALLLIAITRISILQSSKPLSLPERVP